ncbi:hypothetical protein CO019_00485 [Candidatus Berkelbacteria bacterium CG_4_9_14_0_2_um_filter_42_30]|uniref:Multifunctional fusion protein n=5 Tax=Candidatus Berkelbacteria TaxID=1618330 RepID=A0A2M7K198_9BACT|nr:MAG: hypothetical protein COX11_02655 [Candidatus Berkelbacteria bacterium CG23_combo_of_CG06-09_8_20_14_all_41_73]PIR27286.1 MAG: hypothetical protein COV40_01695 [Candidatus Berkelbacteria bacterium CG11_big_fil_rev_8_21_14_0_20_42_15]PIX30032.1 MAG: hypothetical protein COZ63_01880 [Candidatus Berkelbacteria bacterium CG_4_8_14_3_um_filter_42_13]PIZ27416.1 MAG: hypothetical protein COY45_02570 [Candidatus Berkelbacteria bacterium CG_4_10_14_0_8_um_filter_42_34]PJC65857.1 MAG: hypothetical
MKKLEILTDPNPILREKAQPVDFFDGTTQELIDDMIYTMRQADGVGLAAPQVGELKQIIVGEFESKDEPDNAFPLTVIVNPRIKDLSEDKIYMLEGCLSFLGKELYIKRPKKIEIEASDRWGKPINLKCNNLLSRVVQHETDHLNGVLMIDHIKTIKTLFVGNGTLGVPILQRLADDPQFKLFATITALDQPAGRGNESGETAIATQAKQLGVKTFKIHDINDKNTQQQIKNLGPEIIILADFSQIISKEIIEIPKYGVLNIHPSLLPKYRGPSPIVSAILAGEKKTGVSIIKLDQKIDAGSILAQVEVRIKNRETALQLKDRLAEIAADLLAETVPYYLARELSPVCQKEELASYTKLIKKEDGQLSGRESPEVVERMVRAFTPWPGAYQILDGRRIFIARAHLDKEKNLVIDRVKPAGKREMTYQEFMAGNKERLTFNK